MNNHFRIILSLKSALFFFIFAMALPLWAALTQEDLKNDLSYYNRISSKENLNANDRLYILYRLQNKYLNTSLNLNLLDQEIQIRQENRGKGQQTDGEKSESVKTTQQEGPYLTSLDIHKGETVWEVKMELTENVFPEAFLLEDPDIPEEIQIAVDLPNTFENLKKKDKVIKFKDGPLRDMRIISGKENRLRVLFSLREKQEFRVVRGQNRVIFMINSNGKTASSTEKSPEDDRSVSAPSPDMLKALPVPPVNTSTVVSVSSSEETPEVKSSSPQKKPGASADSQKKSKKNKTTAVKEKEEVLPGNAYPTRKGLSITGRIKKPGPYKYRKNYKLSQLVKDAGGVTRGAKSKFVKVYRQKFSGTKILRVNLNRILKGKNEKDFPLRPGDIVLIP